MNCETKIRNASSWCVALSVLNIESRDFALPYVFNFLCYVTNELKANKPL